MQGLAIAIYPKQLTPLPVGMRVINQQPVLRRCKIAAAIAEIGALYGTQTRRDGRRFAADPQRFRVEGLRHQPTFAPKQEVAAIRMVRVASHKYGIGIVIEDTLRESAIERAHINAAHLTLAAADGQVEKAASIRQENWLVQIGLSGVGA